MISLSVNSIRMQQNMDAILSDISSLSGITDQTTVSRGFDFGSFTYMNYEKDGHSEKQVIMGQGNPHYFDFSTFRWKGKKVDCNVQGMVYVSRNFKEQLQKRQRSRNRPIKRSRLSDCRDL